MDSRYMSGAEFAGLPDSRHTLAPDPVSPRLVDEPPRRSLFASRPVGFDSFIPKPELSPGLVVPKLPKPPVDRPPRRETFGSRPVGLAPRPMFVGERSTDPTMRPTPLRAPRPTHAPRSIIGTVETPVGGPPRRGPFASLDTLRQARRRREGRRALPAPSVLFPADRVQVIYYYVYNSSAREMPVPDVNRLNDDLGVLEYIQDNENYINSLRDIPLPKIDIPHQVQTHVNMAPTPRRLYYFRSIGNRYDFTRNEKLKAFINAGVNTGPEEDVWTTILLPPRGFEGSQVLYGTKTSGHPPSRLWDGDVSRSLYITKELRRFAGRLIIKISKAE